MTFSELIGSPTESIEYKYVRPRRYACPECGKSGKRQWVIERKIKHIGSLNSQSWIVAKVGVYQSQCKCCKYFQAQIPGVPLYKDSLKKWWKELEHQLCIFYVIKEVNKLILDGVRTIKNRISRQGNKGRKRRPGRPSKHAQQQRQAQKGRTKKDQATFIIENSRFGLTVLCLVSIPLHDRKSLQIQVLPHTRAEGGSCPNVRVCSLCLQLGAEPAHPGISRTRREPEFLRSVRSIAKS